MRFEQVPHGWDGVPSPVRHIRRHVTCLLTGDTHFGHLIKMMSAKFLLCQVTLFPSMINKDFVGEVLRRYVSILFLIRLLIYLFLYVYVDLWLAILSNGS